MNRPATIGRPCGAPVVLARSMPPLWSKRNNPSGIILSSKNVMTGSGYPPRLIRIETSAKYPQALLIHAIHGVASNRWRGSGIYRADLSIGLRSSESGASPRIQVDRPPRPAFAVSCPLANQPFNPGPLLIRQHRFSCARRITPIRVLRVM
jgi:hypothetical protein